MTLVMHEGYGALGIVPRPWTADNDNTAGGSGYAGDVLTSEEEAAIVEEINGRIYLQPLLDPSPTSPVCAQPIAQRLVILESPYAGNVELHVDYARKCVRDSLMRGEAPIASHLLYTQPGILDDDVPAEKAQGIDAGLAWRRVADGTVVYIDFGISRGMQYGVAAAQEAGRPVEYRRLRDAGRVAG